MKTKILCLLTAVIILFSACAYNNSKVTQNPIDASDTVTFHFIDVGQGDCTLILSEDASLLIDAGTAECGGEICRYLKNLGIDYIDLFIGTHPHEDHLGGASAVLSSVDVGAVFLNGEGSDSYYYERFVDTLLENRITPLIPEMDCIYEFGKIRLKFLSPVKDFGNTNDNSLVAKVTYGDISALFMGDAERSVEAELIKGGKNISCDILKAGHHGSRYASSLEFLTYADPDICVIQSGKGNSYGHPHSEAIERIEMSGAQILRNDKLSDVILSTDGKNIYNASGDKVDVQKTEMYFEKVYTGNKKSRVFHCETCPNLPSEKNSINFKTRDEAINSGYKPCGNCNP